MRHNKNAPQGHEIRVFLSYAASDIELARKLGRLLSQRAGARVFLPENLSAGEDWQARLREELAEADAVVVLVTPEAVHSSWVLHELGAAWGLKKPIFVVASGRHLLRNLPLSPESFRVFETKDLDAPDAAKDLIQQLQDALAIAHPA